MLCVRVLVCVCVCVCRPNHSAFHTSCDHMLVFSSNSSSVNNALKNFRLKNMKNDKKKNKTNLALPNTYSKHNHQVNLAREVSRPEADIVYSQILNQSTYFWAQSEQ